MLRSDFKDTVRQTLQRYDVKDEKLESTLTDLFSAFEQRMLSSEFAEKVSEHQERKAKRESRF